MPRRIGAPPLGQAADSSPSQAEKQEAIALPEYLTRRDQFAMAALSTAEALERWGPTEAGVLSCETIAKRAYELADAMLEARK